MDKEELLDILNNGMTVGDLLGELSKFDKDMLVVNAKGEERLPINSVEETDIDYCYDEIIRKKVVEIW
jgi:hypothetical protein